MAKGVKQWQMEYDGSIQQYPIQPGERWECQYGKLMLNDLYTGLPEFMLAADAVYSDPPWNVGNENAFRTKAGITARSPGYTQFLEAFWRAIDMIEPHTCFLLIGKGPADVMQREMEKRWPLVQRWPAFYYRTKPCIWMRGADHPTAQDYAGLDSTDAIAKMCAREPFTCIADPCMGRGGLAAKSFVYKRQFVGCELNRFRLAVTIAKLARIGAAWNVQKSESAA
jgi:hypothetical protein